MLVLAGGISGVFWSSDGGARWSESTGLGSGGIIGGMDGGKRWKRLDGYGAYVSVSADGRRIYAGDSLRVTASEDGGRSWRDLPAAPNRLTGLSLDGTGRRLVAATEGAGVWRLAVR